MYLWCDKQISSDTCQLVNQSSTLAVPSVKAITSFLLLITKIGLLLALWILRSMLTKHSTRHSRCGLKFVLPHIRDVCWCTGELQKQHTYLVGTDLMPIVTKLICGLVQLQIWQVQLYDHELHQSYTTVIRHVTAHKHELLAPHNEHSHTTGTIYDSRKYNVPVWFDNYTLLQCIKL
jgi:hypothetical protein